MNTTASRCASHSRAALLHQRRSVRISWGQPTPRLSDTGTSASLGSLSDSGGPTGSPAAVPSASVARADHGGDTLHRPTGAGASITKVPATESLPLPQPLRQSHALSFHPQHALGAHAMRRAELIQPLLAGDAVAPRRPQERKRRQRRGRGPAGCPRRPWETRILPALV